jgi:hypothetical protein
MIYNLSLWPHFSRVDRVPGYGQAWILRCLQGRLLMHSRYLNPGWADHFHHILYRHWLSRLGPQQSQKRYQWRSPTELGQCCMFFSTHRYGGFIHLRLQTGMDGTRCHFGHLGISDRCLLRRMLRRQIQ